MKKSQDELIHDAIERLHEKGSNDYESLMREVSKKKKVVNLNLPQLMRAFSKAPWQIDEWGRGTGKTTIRGYRWHGAINTLPRSTGLFIGPTYQFILTRIIPSLVQGLEMFGLYQNLHYFIGKPPPRSWRKSWGTAYQPPDNYNRYITFFNGVGVHLISHGVPGDGRGLNSDWIDGDEAALLSPEKLQENTDPTLRGTNTDKFKGKDFFGWRYYSSSTPLTQEGQFFVDFEEKARNQPELYSFISATCKHNMHNLRPGYLEEAKESAYALWVYLAEYENVRPRFGKNGFYPLLDEYTHCYVTEENDFDIGIKKKSFDCRDDSDLVKGQPLIIGIDWGAAINCLTVNQHLKSIHEYRTLKSMYVLGDDQKIQDDLFQDFHNYYKYHDNKTIFLHYDNSGNVKTGNTKLTRAKQAEQQLKKLGWKPRRMTTGGRNVDHEKKHIVWNMLLKGNDPRLPRYRMNKHNCHNLLLSMKYAKAKPGSNGKIQKDKSSERSQSIPRQNATDLSDANDTPIYNLFRHYLRRKGSALPESTINDMR